MRKLVYACFVILATFFVSDISAATQYTPTYGIAYDSNGWDDAWIDLNAPRDTSPAGIANLRKWFRKKYNQTVASYGQAAGNDFIFQLNRFLSLGSWLDTKWAARVSAWSHCYYVGDVDPHRFFIQFVDSTWTSPQYPGVNYIWGQISTNATNIQVTGWAYIPNNGWVVNGIDTAEWEFGNGLQILKIGLPGSVGNEIGNGCPCAGGC